MYICGQKDLLETLRGRFSGSFPSFTILCGTVGSGRTTLACVLAVLEDIRYYICDSTIAGVREAITKAELDVNTQKIFIFRDLDGMSVPAKNALLKFTEDTPKNTYIIATASNLDNVLNTLISRASVCYMERYSKSDLSDYIEYRKYDLTATEKDSVFAVCTCPGDIDKIANRVSEIYELAMKFTDFIGNTTIGNELKVSTLLSTKENDGKIDPSVFMRCVIAIAHERIVEGKDVFINYQIIHTTSSYVNAILQTGRNKQMLLDNWIIDLHRAVGGEL